MKYLETETNFILIDTGVASKEIFGILKMKGILVRPGWIFGAPTWIRVTISSHNDNEKFFNAIEEALGELRK